jgi:hypothetical protein
VEFMGQKATELAIATEPTGPVDIAGEVILRESAG